MLIAAPAPERWALRFLSCFCSFWTQTPPYARQNESPTRIITYPPYRLADEFVAHALELCPRVLMLLRLALLESRRRSRTPC